MQQSVENGSCNRRIPKDHTPVIDSSVACQDDAFALVTPAHQLEEQVRILRRDRQVADFINDQQLRFAQHGHLLVKHGFLLGFLQHIHQYDCRDKQNRVAFFHRFTPKCYCQMRLAHSRIVPGSTAGCADKSNPSRVQARGKCAAIVANLMRLASL